MTKDTIVQALTGAALQAWVLPSISALFTGVIGRLSEYDWFSVWIGAGFMFVTTTTGLLRFDEWRTRTTARDKLASSSTRIRRSISEDGSINAIALGFAFRNIAIFPIQFSVQGLQTELAGTYPPKKEYPNDTITLPANTPGFSDDHAPGSKTAQSLISRRLRRRRESPAPICRSGP